MPASAYRFLFGPARDKEEIQQLRRDYLGEGGFESADSRYRDYLGNGTGCLDISTPDSRALRHCDL